VRRECKSLEQPALSSSLWWENNSGHQPQACTWQFPLIKKINKNKKIKKQKKQKKNNKIK
jgi:hypothetical protein